MFKPSPNLAGKLFILGVPTKMVVHRAVLPLSKHKIAPTFLYHPLKVCVVCFDVSSAVIEFKAGRGDAGRHSPTDISPLIQDHGINIPCCQPDTTTEARNPRSDDDCVRNGHDKMRVLSPTLCSKVPTRAWLYEKDITHGRRLLRVNHRSQTDLRGSVSVLF